VLRIKPCAHDRPDCLRDDRTHCRISRGVNYVRLRAHVDGLFRKMLMDRGYGFGRPVIDVKVRLKRERTGS
jgi:hypothetical protein